MLSASDEGARPLGVTLSYVHPVSKVAWKFSEMTEPLGSHES